MSLIIKYRPKSFDEIIGQQAIIKSLRGVLKKKTSKAFLFVGSAGTGKTTLARIVANHLGCDSRNIIEIDAASTNGVDAMRDVTASLGYSALGTKPGRMVILDEAGQLSKQAWTSLLKTVEEPPPHVFFAFCTTDGGKVPPAAFTRCTAYTLSPVPTDEINDLLVRVAKEEGMETSEDVIYFIAEKADGSPRQALAGLAMCSRCETRKEAAGLLRTLVDGNTDVIELCRGLAKGTTWSGAMKLLEKIGDVDAEAVRQMVLSYFAKAVSGTTNEETAKKGLAVLSAFERPFVVGNNKHCLLLSLGELLLD
jgi:DNA polymerase III subunit gamma/tau